MANTARTNDRNQEIADTIVGQLGREALSLLGAVNLGPISFSDTSHGVEFSIKGSRSINRIFVMLEANDTYTLHFNRETGGSISQRTGRYVPRQSRVVKIVDDVYSDSLHNVIESVTGLYTSLRSRR
jgi:hypothetical protein